MDPGSTCTISSFGRQSVGKKGRRPWLEDERCRLTNSRPSCRSSCRPYQLAGRTVGLVIVDEVNGFCTVGAGNLAPPAPDAQIARMVEETAGWPGASPPRSARSWRSSTPTSRASPSRPTRRIASAARGEEDLVPELAWLEDCGCATLLRKDCINGFVGGIEASSSAAATASTTTRWSTGSTATGSRP